MWNAKQIEQYKCFGSDGEYIGSYPTNIYNPEYEAWLELGGDPWDWGWDLTNKWLGRTIIPTVADYCDEFIGIGGQTTFICYNEEGEFWDTATFMRTSIVDPANQPPPVYCQYNYWTTVPSEKVATCYNDDWREVGNYADYDYNPIIVNSAEEVDVETVDWKYRIQDKNGKDILYTEYIIDGEWVWAANLPFVRKV